MFTSGVDLRVDMDNWTMELHTKAAAPNIELYRQLIITGKFDEEGRSKVPGYFHLTFTIQYFDLTFNVTAADLDEPKKGWR